MNLEEKILILAPTLFMIMLALILINLCLYFSYLVASPNRISKQMFYFWLIQLIGFLSVSILGKDNLSLVIPFSFNILTFYISYLALFEDHAKLPRFNIFFYLFAGSWCISLVNETLFSNFVLTSLPVAISESLPLVFMIYLVFFSGNKKFQNIHHKWFAIIAAGGIVHNFNFVFFRTDPSALLWGMSGHILLIVSYSILYSNFHVYFRENTENERLSLLVNEKTNELRQKCIELESVSKEKSRLFRIVIHDLSNPITSIINYLSFLKSSKINEREHKPIIEQAYIICTGIVSSIGHVRDMEGINAGKINLEKDLINLNEVFRLTEMIFKMQFEQKNIILEVDNPDKEIHFYGNKELFIHTVLSNLLSNSLKFSMPGTTTRLMYELSNEKIQIMVVDSGKGIKKDKLSKIFNMDTSTSSVGTAGEVGTGFGMPLVKSYIDKVHGKIRIASKSQEESKEDHGTKVELEFNMHKMANYSDQPQIH